MWVWSPSWLNHISELGKVTRLGLGHGTRVSPFGTWLADKTHSDPVAGPMPQTIKFRVRVFIRWTNPHNVSTSGHMTRYPHNVFKLTIMWPRDLTPRSDIIEWHSNNYLRVAWREGYWSILKKLSLLKKIFHTRVFSDLHLHPKAIIHGGMM